MPLQYLAYFPAAVFLGKVSGAALVWGLCVQAGWVLVFSSPRGWCFTSASAHYSGFGG